MGAADAKPKPAKPTFGFPPEAVAAYAKDGREYVLADDGERRVFLAYRPPVAWVMELETPDAAAALLELARELRGLGVRHARVPLPPELLGDTLATSWLDWRPSAALLRSFVRETLGRADDPDARKLLAHLDAGRADLDEALRRVAEAPGWRWLLRGLLEAKLGPGGLAVDVDLGGLLAHADSLSKALVPLKGPRRPGLVPKKVMTRDGRYITYYVSVAPDAPSLGRENLIRGGPGQNFQQVMAQLPVDQLEPRQLAWLGFSTFVVGHAKTGQADPNMIPFFLDETIRSARGAPAETREELERMARLMQSPTAKLGLLASLLFYGGGEPPSDEEIEEIGSHLDRQFTQSESVRNAISAFKAAKGGWGGKPDPLAVLLNTFPIAHGIEWAVLQMADAMLDLPEDTPPHLAEVSHSISNGLRFVAQHEALQRDAEKLRFSPEKRSLRSWLRYDPEDQAFDTLFKEGLSSFEFRYPNTPGIRAFGGPRTIKAVDEQTFEEIQQRLLDDAGWNHDFDLELLGAWDVEYDHPEHEALKEEHPDAEVRTLYHGSDPNRWVGVLAVGALNPNTVGAKVGGMLGPGVYLADASTKSAQYSLGKFTKFPTTVGVMFEMEAVLANKEVVATREEYSRFQERLESRTRTDPADLDVSSESRQAQVAALEALDPGFGEAIRSVAGGQVDPDALARAAFAAQFLRTAAKYLDPADPEPAWQAPTKTVQALWQAAQDPQAREAFLASAPLGAGLVGGEAFDNVPLHNLPEPYASALQDRLDPERLLAEGAYVGALNAASGLGAGVRLRDFDNLAQMIDLRHVDYGEQGAESFAQTVRAAIPADLMADTAEGPQPVADLLIEGYRRAEYYYRQSAERYGYEPDRRELAEAIRADWNDRGFPALYALQQHLRERAAEMLEDREAMTMLYAAYVDGGLDVLDEGRPEAEQAVRHGVARLTGQNFPYTVEADASSGWLRNNEWMVQAENQVRIKRILHVRERKGDRRD